MARYLVERAPTFAGTGERSSSNIDSLWRKTSVERALILKKEEAIKGLCELCVLRCIRRDHLLVSLERFTRNVLDPDYIDFKTDILPKWEAERQLGAAQDMEKSVREAEESNNKSMSIATPNDPFAKAKTQAILDANVELERKNTIAAKA